MRKVCKVCEEEYHHKPEWIQVPDSCVCALGTWTSPGDGKRKIPPVCGKYQGPGKPRNCDDCGHDEECHS